MLSLSLSLKSVGATGPRWVYVTEREEVSRLMYKSCYTHQSPKGYEWNSKEEKFWPFFSVMRPNKYPKTFSRVKIG